MNKGDAFVLISDGLPECENPKGVMLDYPKVEECVKKNGDKSAQGIIDSLVNLGENWMDGRMNDDDITLVVIKKPKFIGVIDMKKLAIILFIFNHSILSK